MTFSKALELIKSGKLVSRVAWMGTSKFIFLVPGSSFKVNRPPLDNIYPEGTLINYKPHIDINNGDNNISVWNPSQDDILADDYNEYFI